MDAQIKAQWVAALRSGEYHQVQTVLHNADLDAYCCLGVLCDLAVKAGEKLKVLPGQYFGGVEAINVASYDGEKQVLPRSVQLWAGLDEDDPAIEIDPEGYDDRSLAQINDEGATFAEIADLIEREL